MNEISIDKRLNIQTLGYYIERTLSVMIKRLNQELKKEGLEFQHSHFSTMKILNTLDNICQTDLCKITGKDRASISRTLKFLEEKGYVMRQSLNGCKNGISLTDKGREIMPLLEDISKRVTDRAFMGFKNETRQNIFESLCKIYNNSL